ncbi:MAG: hypothetical protein LLG14_02405, partial [Nocardiaceae bacterium]|nr:hypothetical protein [Nocardiaceae bacterium]
MVSLETGLISMLTDTAELQLAMDMGVSESLFEDPQNRAVFTLIREYWERDGIAPTREVLLHEFSSQDLSPREESTFWLVEALQKRYASNAAQDLMRSAARITNDDPHEALRILHTGSAEMMQAAGCGPESLLSGLVDAG